MKLIEQSKLLISLLDLNYIPIGVKFLVNETDYNDFKCREVQGRCTYCLMVKNSKEKGIMKATVKNINCPGAARALGLMEVSNDFKSGEYGRNLKLYKNLLVSKFVAKKITFCRHLVKGVAVGPLKDFEENPDILIMIMNPYRAMRLVQAHTCNNGIHDKFTISGNQAFCSELTAVPYENNTINISLLCSGTRFVNGWGESDMGVGFPYHFTDDIIDGLISTLNSVEPNSKKEVISENLSRNECEKYKIDIRLNENYYRNVYNLKK